LTIWRLGVPISPNVHPDTNFEAVGEWTLISNVLLIDRIDSFKFRVEFYIGTTNANLDIDSVVAYPGAPSF